VELDKLKIDEFPDAEGLFVYASDGVRIGRVSTIVFDEASRELLWIAVSTGLFGRKRLFVPVEGASLDEDGIDVMYTKDEIENSPDVDPVLSAQEGAALREYYAPLSSDERVETALLMRAVTRPAREDEEEFSVDTRDEAVGGKSDPEAREVSDLDALVASGLDGEVVERKLEQGEVERIAVDGEDSGEVEILPDGSVSIPLIEEQVILTKRVIVRERIIVRKTTTVTQMASGADALQEIELRE
jgi:stress response protein YsnF